VDLVNDALAQESMLQERNPLSALSAAISANRNDIQIVNDLVSDVSGQMLGANARIDKLGSEIMGYLKLHLPSSRLTSTSNLKKPRYPIRLRCPI
jgi:hypothetical protein